MSLFEVESVSHWLGLESTIWVVLGICLLSLS
jgi:hypothetical protein